MRNSGLAQAYAVGFHCGYVLSALSMQVKDAFDQGIQSFKKSGMKFNNIAKANLVWVKAHPYILGIVGFEASGIVAGSIAAGVQAGIGSVAAGSAVTVLTNAEIGGYGAIIVFDMAWAVPASILSAIQGGDNNDDDGDGDEASEGRSRRSRSQVDSWRG
ncbi:hypothetical protein BU25DRAFT_494297 [Macroventuria anomochaeta]|uniref:Uncharacterized protein n=1 Tax=Macroventuria anomochaeta TaxID=301207 RepID=A0ACB6RP92_9PLEO|nr:uncharacterized protein BU25DRAFT_494297 [Macroventuria anomochaeta]KAF2623599.1 hypothetical protein BU25DRAFT_494297 [Macroventuria anomochaeta]